MRSRANKLVRILNRKTRQNQLKTKKKYDALNEDLENSTFENRESKSNSLAPYILQVAIGKFIYIHQNISKFNKGIHAVFEGLAIGIEN